MKKRINIIFSHFDYPKTLSVNDIVNVFKTLPYNEDIGFGYTDVEINSGIIYATLIKRSITTLLEYDLKNKDFIKKEIPVFEEISFGMDFEKLFLYTYGVTSNHNKIKSALRNTFEMPFTYTNVDTSPINIMNKIISNVLNYKIEEVVIQRFTYNNGATGKYTAKITKQSIGEKLLNEYLSDIVKVSISIFEQDEFQLVISTNASISIKCNENDFYSILENIKNKIYG